MYSIRCVSQLPNWLLHIKHNEFISNPKLENRKTMVWVNIWWAIPYAFDADLYIFSCLFWAYFSLWILIKMVTHMHSDRAFIVIFFNKPGDFLRHFSLAATTQSRLLYKPKYHTQIYPLQFTYIISRMLGYDACLSYTKFYFYAVFLPTGFFQLTFSPLRDRFVLNVYVDWFRRKYLCCWDFR